MPLRPKRKRLLTLVISMASLGIAALLIIPVFQENLVYFQSPSDLQESAPDPDKRIRIGGLVKDGSTEKITEMNLRFTITDGQHEIPVQYEGLVPTLFREGQGVIAEGKLAQGVFQAEKILTKHDENYMPPEVAKALKDAGHWQNKADTP